MKTISIFILLIYWSIIILAPVISKENKLAEITNLIKEKNGAEVSPSQIILKEDLNKVGLFKADINFHSDVKAQISIKIDKIQSK